MNDADTGRPSRLSLSFIECVPNPPIFDDFFSALTTATCPLKVLCLHSSEWRNHGGKVDHDNLKTVVESIRQNRSPEILELQVRKVLVSNWNLLWGGRGGLWDLIRRLRRSLFEYSYDETIDESDNLNQSDLDDILWDSVRENQNLLKLNWKFETPSGGRLLGLPHTKEGPGALASQCLTEQIGTHSDGAESRYSGSTVD